jgi:hypothetical protein
MGEQHCGERHYKDVVAGRRAARANEHHGFNEVFLIETTVAWYSATLYGDPKRSPKLGAAK